MASRLSLALSLSSHLAKLSHWEPSLVAIYFFRVHKRNKWHQMLLNLKGNNSQCQMQISALIKAKILDDKLECHFRLRTWLQPCQRRPLKGLHFFNPLLFLNRRAFSDKSGRFRKDNASPFLLALSIILEWGEGCSGQEGGKLGNE